MSNMLCHFCHQPGTGIYPGSYESKCKLCPYEPSFRHDGAWIYLTGDYSSYAVGWYGFDRPEQEFILFTKTVLDWEPMITIENIGNKITPHNVVDKIKYLLTFQ